MEEMKIRVFSELLACIRRKDKKAFRDMLSASLHISVNQMVLSCEEATDCVIERFGLVESKTEKYRIDLMAFNSAELSDGLWVIEGVFRLNLRLGSGAWEYCAEIIVILFESKIIFFHYNRAQLPPRKYAIQANRSTILLPEKEVRLLESRGNYILWHCNDGVYKERGVLDKRKKELSGRFLSVRKSHCVNLDYVKSYRWHEIEVMDEDVPITIPKSRYEEVRDFMDRWTLLEGMIIDSRIRE